MTLKLQWENTLAEGATEHWNAVEQILNGPVMQSLDWGRTSPKWSS